METISTHSQEDAHTANVSSPVSIPLTIEDNVTGKLRVRTDEEMGGSFPSPVQREPWARASARTKLVAVCLLLVALLLLADCTLVALVDVDTLTKRGLRVFWGCVAFYHAVWIITFVDCCNRFRISQRVLRFLCPCCNSTGAHDE